MKDVKKMRKAEIIKELAKLFSAYKNDPEDDYCDKLEAIFIRAWERSTKEELVLLYKDEAVYQEIHKERFEKLRG